VYPHLENGRFYAHTTLILQRFFDVFVTEERIQRAEQAALSKAAAGSTRRSKAASSTPMGSPKAASNIRAQADRINPFYATVVPLAIYRRVEVGRELISYRSPMDQPVCGGLFSRVMADSCTLTSWVLVNMHDRVHVPVRRWWRCFTTVGKCGIRVAKEKISCLPTSPTLPWS